MKKILAQIFVCGLAGFAVILLTYVAFFSGVYFGHVWECEAQAESNDTGYVKCYGLSQDGSVIIKRTTFGED